MLGPRVQKSLQNIMVFGAQKNFPCLLCSLKYFSPVFPTVFQCLKPVEQLRLGGGSSGWNKALTANIKDSFLQVVKHCLRDCQFLVCPAICFSPMKALNWLLVIPEGFPLLPGIYS